MRIITYILLVLIILLGISFACLNADKVTVNYYIGNISGPLSLILVFTLGFGMLCGFLASLIAIIRAKKHTYTLKHRIKVLEKEVDNLRSIPLKK